jgi:hypothetical protein
MWRVAAVLLIVCPPALAMPIPRLLRLPDVPNTTRIEAHTDAGRVVVDQIWKERPFDETALEAALARLGTL